MSKCGEDEWPCEGGLAGDSDDDNQDTEPKPEWVVVGGRYTKDGPTKSLIARRQSSTYGGASVIELCAVAPGPINNQTHFEVLFTIQVTSDGILFNLQHYTPIEVESRIFPRSDGIIMRIDAKNHNDDLMLMVRSSDLLRLV